MRIKKSHILGALVVLTILFAYVPALKSGYVWDDNVYVTNNHTLRTAEGLGRIWTEPGANIQYYPLVFTSFWMEYHLWGLHPFGYHLVNVVLHLFNVLLVWLILRRLGVRWAGLAAAVFALHPVQVESVAWITERKNLLSGAFYLAAVLVYLRFSGLGESDSAGSDRARSGRSWGLYALVAFLFVLALLSKTVAATLPVTLLVITWWKRGTLEWTDVLPLVPLFVLGVAMGSLTVYLEKTQVGASGHEWGLSIIDRSGGHQPFGPHRAASRIRR